MPWMDGMRMRWFQLPRAAHQLRASPKRGEAEAWRVNRLIDEDRNVPYVLDT